MYEDGSAPSLWPGIPVRCAPSSETAQLPTTLPLLFHVDPMALDPQAEARGFDLWVCWQQTRDQSGPRGSRDSALERLQGLRQGRAGVTRSHPCTEAQAATAEAGAIPRHRPSSQPLPLPDETDPGSWCPCPTASR